MSNTNVRLKIKQNHFVERLRRNDFGSVWLQGA